MDDKTTMTRIALMYGMLIADLKELHDKVPEEHELILKLTKDVSKLIHQHSLCSKGWDDNALMDDVIYNHITGKF